MKPLSFLTTILFAAMPITLFGWLLWIDVDPDGKREFVFTPGESSPYFGALVPSDRVNEVRSETAGNFQDIIGDPAYLHFTLPPSAYESMEIEMDFVPGAATMLELGPVNDPITRNADLQSIYAQTLDTLDWSQMSDGEYTLWQREQDYTSIEEFLANPPKRSSIATYHADVDFPYGDVAPTGSQTVDYSLRGYHRFYIQAQDDMVLQLQYDDMNRTVGEDEVRVIIRDAQGEEMGNTRYYDDGNASSDQRRSEHEHQYTETRLPAGAYIVDLIGTSDIFWRHIEVNSPTVTFINQVYLGDVTGYLDTPESVVLYSDAKHLSFETRHAEGVQDILVNGEVVSITSTHEVFTYEVDIPGLVRIEIPHGDVQVTGSGKFGFSESAFYHPDAATLTAYSDIDLLEFDYILAQYTPPTESAGVLTGSSTFSLENIFTDDGVMTLAIGLPTDEQDAVLATLHEMRITLHKAPLDTAGIINALLERIPGL